MLQYALTSLGFLLIGFALVVIIRWQLAYPGRSIPLLGVIAPEVYNQLGTMHGTIMIYMDARDVIQLNVPMSYAALALGAFQIVFVANVFGSLRFRTSRRGKPVGRDDAGMGARGRAAARVP